MPRQRPRDLPPRGRVDHDLEPVPRLDRGDVRPPLATADLDLARPLGRLRLLVAVPIRVLVQCPAIVALEHEHALPGRQHDLVAPVAVQIDELEVVDRMQRAVGDLDGQAASDGFSGMS